MIYYCFQCLVFNCCFDGLFTVNCCFCCCWRRRWWLWRWTQRNRATHFPTVVFGILWNLCRWKEALRPRRRRWKIPVFKRWEEVLCSLVSFPVYYMFTSCWSVRVTVLIFWSVKHLSPTCSLQQCCQKSRIQLRCLNTEIQLRAIISSG